MKLFIDTDWYDIIQDLPKEKQIEIMGAILAFPNGDSNTHIWKKVIKPQLEQSAKLYKEKADRFAENRKKRWEQKSEQIYKQISDKKSEQILNRCQNVNVNVNEKDNIVDTSLLQTTRESFTPPTLEEFLTTAKQWNDTAGMGGFACTRMQAESFWSHYDSQGWMKSNGYHITNIRSAFLSWVKREQAKQDTNEPVRAGGVEC